MSYLQSTGNAQHIDCEEDAHVKPEEFFCCPCEVFCCVKCLKRHREHEFVEFDESGEINAFLRGKLERYLEVLQKEREKIDAILLQVSQQISSAQHSSSLYLSELSHTFSEGKALLQAYTDRKKTLALEYKKPQYQSLDRFKDEVERRLSVAKSHLQSVQHRQTALQSCTSLSLLLTSLPFLKVARVTPPGPAPLQPGILWMCSKGKERRSN